MKRLCFVLLLVLSASACGAGSGDERTVLVDYSHDEFASFIISNFPKEVAVAAGSAVVFKQIWTGEPHTVTGGTLVNTMMEKAEFWIPFFEGFEEMMASGAELPDPEDAPPGSTVADLLDAVEAVDDEAARKKFLDAYDALVDEGSDLPPRADADSMSLKEADEVVTKESDAVFDGSGLPWALDETEDGDGIVTQNAGQPCFLSKGAPPEDADKPCAEAQQRQTAFNGRQTYYNSGIIPYEGPQGNTFRVDIASDAKPGSYFFYCAVHGPSQYTKVDVRAPGSKVPSQREVTEQTQKEIAAFAKPMKDFYEQALDGTIEVEGDEVRGPFAGLSPPVHGSINEFLPRTIRTRVGEPVRWKLMGSDHTITFDVPKYFPVVTFAKDGTVALNKRLQDPAGGSPDLPEGSDEGPPGSGPPEIVRVDGGTYDGTGFFSSGLFGGMPYAEYTLRFSEPGTYKYACLLHPPMVGTVEVT